MFFFFKLILFFFKGITSTILTLTAEVLIKNNGWSYFLYVMPDFAFRHAINVLYLKYQNNKVSIKINNMEDKIEIPERIEYTGDFFDPLDITKFIVYMLVVGVLFMIILIKCFENIYLYDKFMNAVRKMLICRKKSKLTEIEQLDGVNVDVEEEAKLVKTVIDGKFI